MNESTSSCTELMAIVDITIIRKEAETKNGGFIACKKSSNASWGPVPFSAQESVVREETFFLFFQAL